MKKLLIPALALILAGLGPLHALADDVSNNLDATVDANLEVLNLNVGGSNGTVSFNLIPRNGDGKNGCNLTGNTEFLTVGFSNGDSSKASISPAAVTFNNCNDTKTITVHPLAVGQTNIIASVSSTNVTSTFNVAPASFTVNVNPPADTTPPVITPTLTGTLGSNGWYVSDVNVSWTVSDPQSAVSSTTGCGPSVVNTDTTGQTFTCSATSAGGTASQSVTVKRDASAPLITASAVTSGDSNTYSGAWINQNVVVTFVCNGAVSGVSSLTAPVTVSTEGANQSVSGTCVDNAGNSASVSFTGINIDKTAPHYGIPSRASGSEPNPNGWNNTDVTVNFPCEDDLSGVVNSMIAETVGTEGAGQSVSAPAAACVDNAGNVAASGAASPSDINIDKTAPIITAGTPTGTLGNNGWYTSPVTVPFSATDELSGFDPHSQVLSVNLPDGVTSGDGSGLTVTSGTVTDLAGNVATAVSAGPFNVDTTAPAIAFVSALPAANGAGWNNSDVTLTWSCADSVSGVVASTVSATISTEGINQSATGTCENMAGLQASNTHSGINIDKTAPNVVSSNDHANYLLGQSATVNFTCTDPGVNASGIATCSGTVANGSTLDTSTAGPHSFTVTATDNAGNTTVKVVSYEVFHFVGLLQPISVDSKTFKKNSTIPVKFQLTDDHGNFFGGVGATLNVMNGSTPVPAVSSGGSNSGNNFRYDPTAQQYIFNLSTSMPVFTAGHTYTLRVTLSTGNFVDGSITLK